MKDDTITPIDQPDGITYGDSSRDMWELINRTSKHSYSVWRALYAMGCKMQELESLVTHMSKAKLDIAITALERIAFPIKAIQEHLKDGEKLNGQMAQQLSNDPQFLKDIAREALEKLGIS